MYLDFNKYFFCKLLPLKPLNMKTILFFLLLLLGIESCYSQTKDFRLFVYAKDCHGIGTCDGKGIMKIQGGTPPYTLTFQSNSITDSTGLVCEGFYSATCVDNNAQTSIFNFIVGSPTATYSNITPNQTPVDTLYENAIERCDVRYTEIDSIRITNHQWVGTDSIKITWSVYQKSNYTSVFDKTYAYPKVGLCRFILYMYCSGVSRSTSDHVRGEDEVTVPQRTQNPPPPPPSDPPTSPLSVSFDNPDNTAISVFPNPFSDMIIVQSDEKGSVKIIDTNGKIAFASPINSGKTTINTSNFSNGVYTLFMESSKHVTKVLIVK